MKYFILFFLSFFWSISKAQDVKITFKNLSEPELLAPHIYAPINGFTNIFNEGSYPVIDKEKKSISWILKPQESGFVIIELLKVGKIKLFIQPGDSIEAKVKNIGTGNQIIEFSGSNYQGQSLQYNNTLFEKQHCRDFVDSLFRVSKDADFIFSRLQKLNRDQYNLLNSLELSKVITPEFSNNLNAEQQAMIFFFTENYLMNVLRSERDASSDKVTKDEALKLVKLLIKRYDPFSLKYLKTTFSSANNGDVCKLMKLGFLPPTEMKDHIWKDLGDEYQHFAYAPMEYQHLQLGSNVLFNIKYGIKSKEQINLEFQRLVSNFPNSEFIPVITNLLNDGIAEESRSKEDRSDFAIYNRETESLRYLNHPAYKAINDLLANDVFKGKAVFVDFWATWCSPCRAEFAYKKNLDAFLAKNRVEVLYISFDEGSFEKGWSKFIKQYHLSGYHYLSTPEFKSSLKTLFQSDVMGIPRYMLFDHKGILLDSDLPRPSSGQKLYSILKERLKL